MRSFLLASLLLLFSPPFARAQQPRVPDEVLKKAFERKNFFVLGLQHADNLKKLVGLYETQVPTEIERVETKLYGPNLALGTARYEARAFVLVQSLVGYYPLDRRPRATQNTLAPLFRVDAVHEVPPLGEDEWIVLEQCTRGAEPLVSVVKLTGQGKTPLKAWTLDPKTKALVPADVATVSCRAPAKQ